MKKVRNRRKAKDRRNGGAHDKKINFSFYKDTNDTVLTLICDAKAEVTAGGNNIRLGIYGFDTAEVSRGAAVGLYSTAAANINIAAYDKGMYEGYIQMEHSDGNTMKMRYPVVQVQTY